MTMLSKGSIQSDVLALFRTDSPVHMDTFCKKLGVTERQVRNAIDGLRARGHSIKWDGPKTWCLR